MDLFHALLGSLFTILITGSVSFIAYKVLTISNEVSEIREIVKQLQQESLGVTGVPGQKEVAVANRFPTPLPDLDDLDTPRTPEKEFVLPPPISRRLDAERGLASDDLTFGVKSSERRH
ncbi:MAG TPA: hypothetical protein VGL53_16465 [Bryobacteraceae bacterium]|jgi:hypothetical protein